MVHATARSSAASGDATIVMFLYNAGHHTPIVAQSDEGISRQLIEHLGHHRPRQIDIRPIVFSIRPSVLVLMRIQQVLEITAWGRVIHQKGDGRMVELISIQNLGGRGGSTVGSKVADIIKEGGSKVNEVNVAAAVSA